MTTTQGFVSAFQDYSTNDGPGLRNTVFLKWCNLNCLWCANPEALLPDPEVYFFPERIVDAELALAENFGSVSQSGGQWEFDRTRLGDLDELVERNTQPLFEEVGRWVDVDTCVTRLIRDEVFYQASHGGVTFSGGEPMLQVNFIREVFATLRERGIHTAIDTAGDVPYTYFESVLDDTDLFLYDIKTADAGLHRELTGVNNGRILENAQRLARDARDIWVRLVLVPGLNDSFDDLRKRLDIVAAMGPVVSRVDLLGYHSLGVGKYRRLGREYPLGRLPPPDKDVLRSAEKYAEELCLPFHYEPGV
jgi:pyruvate formate lyase activating enzyme